MIVQTINSIWERLPYVDTQRVYTTLIDPQTLKQVTEIVVYSTYNAQGREEHHELPNKGQHIDLRA